MSSIFILKEILDLLYEESKRGELVTTDIENRLRTLERQLEDKNKELSKLYTENIRLENILRKYETEFEILSKMPIIPIQTPINNKKSDTSYENSDKNSVSTNSESNSIKSDSQKKRRSKAKSDTDSVKTEKESVKTEKESVKPENKRRDRKEYMAEYQRNYRKMKREQKTEINV